MGAYRNYKYTTEHMSDGIGVLVSIDCKNGVEYKFFTEDYGDWNPVEKTIHSAIDAIIDGRINVKPIITK